MINKLPWVIKLFLYELFPNLYFKKVEYKLEGYCNKCGDCCRYICCRGPFAILDVKLMALLFPKYRRFKIIGKDPLGNLILACKLIGEDGMCPDYEKRPGLCRSYPDPNKGISCGNLYGRCSYKLIPQKPFEKYINT